MASFSRGRPRLIGSRWLGLGACTICSCSSRSACSLHLMSVRCSPQQSGVNGVVVRASEPPRPVVAIVYKAGCSRLQSSSC